MKKSYLSVGLLLMSLGLVACGGNSSSTSTAQESSSTSSKTSEKTSTETSSTTSSQTSTTSSTAADSTGSSGSAKGQTYTGFAYDDISYTDGNITLIVSSSETTADNNKITRKFGVYVNNNATHSLDFTMSDTKFLSNNGDEFSSDDYSLTFDGTAILPGKSAKIAVSAKFTDEHHDSDTAYYLSFTLTDSDKNTYHLCASCDNKYYFFESTDVELYEGQETTVDGLKIATEGSNSYDSYALKSTDVLTITNTGASGSFYFPQSNIELVSISNPTSSTYENPSVTLDGSSFYDYYDPVTFNTDSVLKIDFSSRSIYGFNESDLPVQFDFKVYDMTNEMRVKITFKMTPAAAE